MVRVTARIQDNWADGFVQDTVQGIRAAVREVREQAKNVRPYGGGTGQAHHANQDEEDLLYDNPAELVRLKWGEQHAVDPTTGMPITNDQARVALVNLMGPKDYVKWVTEVARRRNRQQPESEEVPPDAA